MEPPHDHASEGGLYLRRTDLEFNGLQLSARGAYAAGDHTERAGIPGRKQLDAEGRRHGERLTIRSQVGNGIY